MNKESKALSTQKERITNSSILNHITAARGTRVLENEDNYITAGYSDVQFWIPAKQSWIPASQNSDKFLVCVESPDGDHSTAWSEFFSRWRIYCKKRFNTNYIKIEAI